MYEEEIARSLGIIAEQNKPVPGIAALPRLAERQNFGLSDGTVIKFAMVVGVVVIAYLIIKSFDGRQRRR